MARPVSAMLWFAGALLACLSVTLLNGGGLSYFDTAGYLERGQASLASFGVNLAPEPVAGDTPGAAAGPAGEDDDVVIGSRSAVYAIMMALARFTVGLGAIPVLHALAIGLALAVPVRVAHRRFCPHVTVAPLIAVPLIVASLGALPFYTAYLMPDIFAPALIILVAALGAFAREMTWFERAVAVAFGIVAAVTHPSHLPIVVLMIPVAALMSLILERRRWWLAPVLVALIPLGALAERIAFTSAVKAVRGAEVIYNPFLTVRVIADGPGYRFLEATCPDADVSACALYDALQLSDDPLRLTASHIMFETSPELGSYRLLPVEDQHQIANDQVRFFQAVLLDRPLQTTQAFLRNMLIQAAVFQSVRQTVPTTAQAEHLYSMSDLVPQDLRDGRLVGLPDEIAALLDVPHRVLYVVSLLVILGLIVHPRSGVPPAIRVFATILVAGVLVNALVCGGISQPSNRYGARVVFLLPIAATLLWMFRGRGRALRAGDPSG